MPTNQENPEWFITSQNGAAPIVDFTTFLGFQYVKNSNLPVKPVENGGFITANKWSSPYVVDVQIAKSGSQSEIRDMLAGLDYLLNSVLLVDIVTPVRVFTNGTIANIEYSFSGNETGPSMVTPTITIQEVKFFYPSERIDSEITEANARNSETVTGQVVGKIQPEEVPSSYLYRTGWFQ